MKRAVYGESILVKMLPELIRQQRREEILRRYLKYGSLKKEDDQ